MTVMAYRIPRAFDLADRQPGDVVRFRCDTEAEVPTVNVIDGDTAVTLDSHKKLIRVNGQWVSNEHEAVAAWGCISGTISEQHDLINLIENGA